MKLPCTILAATLQLATNAAVPLAWTARPNQPQPASFDRHHGETLEFRCTFSGFGDGTFAQASDIRLWYQTNGMASAWWSTPATVVSNVLSATWTPNLDPGADRVSLFFGAPSNVYASAVLRLRHSPGFTPSELTPPIQRLDFAAVEIANAPYYTRAETEAKIVELSPAPGNYAAVSNAAMSAAAQTNDFLRLSGGRMTGNLGIWQCIDFFYGNNNGMGIESHTPIALKFWSRYPGYEHQSAILDLHRVPENEQADIAYLHEVSAAATANTNYTDAAIADFASTGSVGFAESAGSTSYAEEAGAANKLYDADMENSYTASDFATTNEVAELRTENTLVYRLYQGSNVVAEVTNYSSSVHAPELRIMQLNESNEYVTVWTETNGLARTLAAAKQYADVATGEVVKAVAPRAWSRTTSGLGADAPPNTTWISTPRTVIAGGLEYAKIADTYGEVWVLTSNGMAADFNPDTNAYFRITADDGTPVFSIEKSDAQTVGADADNIVVTASTVTMPVGVVSTEHPTMYWRQALDSGSWADESSPPSGAAVSWSGTAGAWVCTVTWSGTRPASMFFKFTFIQEGGVVIRNNATTDISSGVYVNGVKFVPSVSGNNLIWTKQ